MADSTKATNLTLVGAPGAADTTGGTGGGGGIESRVAAVEVRIAEIHSDVRHVQSDITEIKGDVRSLLWAGISAVIILTLVMAAGFGWIGGN